MTIDYDDLRAKAQRATPGPWTVDVLSQDAEGEDGIAQVPAVLTRATSDGDYMSIVNAAYIAAASPSVVLALLEERELLLRAILRNGPSKDHACSECIPGGPIVVAGFRCDYHHARAALGEETP